MRPQGFGAGMLGYLQNSYHRLPWRNEPLITWH
jgi:hypothetical protein